MVDMLGNDDIKCSGCGIAIQSDNQNQAGYIPAKALEKKVENAAIVCQRCFKIKHYSEPAPVHLTDEDFLRILHRIGAEKGLIVKIVDIFDLNGSWINGIQRFVHGNPVLLVANKVDLLPKGLNMNRLKNWLQQTAKENGLKPIDVLFCSAEKGTGIEELMEKMDSYRQGEDIFVVGMTNVGKSSLINRILQQLGFTGEDYITTSLFPGTTLDVIDIPLEDGKALHDTPGIINPQQMAHYVSADELKIISPKKPLKPKVYQLNAAQTLFFGGLARFDYLKGDRQSFVCYISNDIHIHRTKLEQAEELYKNHVGEMLQPPKKVDIWGGLVRHTFKLPKEPTDIVFSGLGWITVKGTGGEIACHAPEGVGILLRKALI